MAGAETGDTGRDGRRGGAGRVVLLGGAVFGALVVALVILNGREPYGGLPEP